MKQKIGIITLGSDCSGVNSVIYSIYKMASLHKLKVMAIKKGLTGFIQDDYVELNEEICSPDLLWHSGSIIKTSNNRIKDKIGCFIPQEQLDDLIVSKYHKLGLCGLIFIGGEIDDIKRLAKNTTHLNIAYIPKTIDNDIMHTDLTIGFLTAVKVISDEIKNVIDTAKTHGRVMIVEVMGKLTGHLALHAGTASGADIILIPEIEFNIDNIEKKVKNCFDSGKNFAIIIVAEAVNYDFGSVTLSKLRFSENLASFLEEKGYEAKTVVLGHTQRGGQTVVLDRMLAQKLGIKAVQQILNFPQHSCMITTVNSDTKEIPIEKVSNEVKKVDLNNPTISLAQDLGIYVGEVKHKS